MDKNITAQDKFNRLRRQAEELIRANSPKSSVPFDDPLKLIHELQTLQIELELQNEELRHSQQELIKYTKNYTELYNFAPVGYLTTGPRGFILNANLTFADMLSMESASLIKQPLSAYIIFEDQDIYYRHMRALAKSEIQHICELRMEKKDGTVFDVQLQSTPVLVEGQDTYQIRTVVIDITDRKQAEAEKKELESQLRQSQKMESLGTLAGGIAHDFNNILCPIVGYGEMLLDDLPEDSPLWFNINEIFFAAMRAVNLVKQILTFAHADTPELKPIRIQPVIKEALKLMRATIPTTIEIKQDIRSVCGEIKADSTQIHQIIMNLTTNAYHAMEETGGELNVGLKEMELCGDDAVKHDIKPGVYACLTVKDTGMGMHKDVKERIFDPYFTTKAQDKGSGMGLSVVHGIVSSMGGAIQVYSEVDTGTEFHVYLPVLKEKEESEQLLSKNKNLIQGGSEEILIVDDEVSIIKLETKMLRRLGYGVTACSNGVDAIEIFRADPHRFDMVITDMAMPNIAGDELAVEFLKIRPDIPILLCTGFSSTMSAEKALALGIKGFIMKPIVKNTFLLKIREVLDEHKK